MNVPFRPAALAILPGVFRLVTACLGLLLAASAALHADTLQVIRDSGEVRARILGDEDEDWHLEASTNLADWVTLESAGTFLGGTTHRPFRAVTPTSGDAVVFHRARRTDGLFDDQLVRTLSLTFTQANWQTRLTQGRTTGSNTVGNLALDNGAALDGIGARYRGNTSFTGMGGAGTPIKKSINLTLDETDPDGDLMGYDTVNLNNAYGDETILREAVYFGVMRQYTVCPRASLARLFINGSYWGVYSFVQQQDGDLLREWFPSSDGDRWRAPNMGGGTGGGGPPGPGGGGGFGGGASALTYLGAQIASYRNNYELKTDHSTNAWERLVHAIDVLNRTSAVELRNQLETVLAVDRWLWFLVLENAFADDDSYFNKGADYQFYFEPESGRIHPVEHDGNEAFVAGDVRLSPVQGEGNANRPVLAKVLGNPELRQRYLAHYRTVLAETFNPAYLNAVIARISARTAADIAADTRKGFTMQAYTNDLNSLRNFIAQRHAYLTNHAELKPIPPRIVEVQGPDPLPTAAAPAIVTAKVQGNGTDGVDSVWLHHRARAYGRFAAVEMLDDGAHGDRDAGDGLYGAVVPAHPAGTRVRYYVEARSAAVPHPAAFAPARAEQETYSYRVALITASNSPVVINEFMADNTLTRADPQGEYDDWIELRNLTDAEVDLTGHYLSDEPNNPRKWPFPNGTRLPAHGYLLVWADEDGKAPEGLHASFRLHADGEQLYLTDTDARLNAVLDSITFGPQAPDRSYGRTAANPDSWAIQDPTPGSANK